MMRKKTVITILVLIILVVLGYVAYSTYKQPAVEEPLVEEDEGLPVIAPDIQTEEDVAALTAGKNLPPLETDKRMPVIDPSYDHIRGDVNTDIAIVSYMSVDNAYSKILYKAMQNLLAANQATMHWVFRHYPTAESAVDYPAADASECVWTQLRDNGFWSYMDTLMQQPSVAAEMISSTARAVGVDVAAYDQCMAQGLTKDYAILSKRDAQLDLELFVTPSVVFFKKSTGEIRIAAGANTTDYLQSILDDFVK